MKSPTTFGVVGAIQAVEAVAWRVEQVFPLARRTARVGSGAELLPDSVLVRYSHTGASAALTSTMRLLFAAARQGRAGRRDAVPEISVRGPEPLGVVRSDDAAGTGFVRAVPELPHDGVRVRIDLDDELIIPTLEPERRRGCSGIPCL